VRTLDLRARVREQAGEALRMPEQLRRAPPAARRELGRARRARGLRRQAGQEGARQHLQRSDVHEHHYGSRRTLHVTVAAEPATLQAAPFDSVLQRPSLGALSA